jgi:hypothetical protein
MKFHFGRLGRRYGKSRRGHAAKRDEGVSVDREKGRLYYVDGKGHVMSAPMKNR